jgi:hypothetical protein
MTKRILFILAILNGGYAQVLVEDPIKIRTPAIKESIAPSNKEEDLIISLYTECSSYRPEPIGISSVKISREKTMQGLYEEVAKKLTKEYEETARRLMEAFPSLNRAFQPLTPDDFFLYNRGQRILNYADIVVDRLARRNDPYWGDKYIRLSIHLTDSGKKKIGWISPFASVYIDPFKALKSANRPNS